MTLVLIHPIAMDANCWRDLALPGALTPELAGHGGRPYPGRPLSLPDLADDLAETLPGMLPDGDDPLDLVGVAFGGCVAQHLALRHPRRLRSLMLVNTTCRSDPQVMRQRAREVAEHGIEPILDVTLRRWFSPAAVDDPDHPGHPGVAYARRRLREQDPRMYADCWNAMAAHDVASELGRITVPVTVVGSTGDQSVSLDKVGVIHERLPHSRLETLDGPHMIHLERPARLAIAIAGHLARVPGPPDPAGAADGGGGRR